MTECSLGKATKEREMFWKRGRNFIKEKKCRGREGKYYEVRERSALRVWKKIEWNLWNFSMEASRGDSNYQYLSVFIQSRIFFKDWLVLPYTCNWNMLDAYHKYFSNVGVSFVLQFSVAWFKQQVAINLGNIWTISQMIESLSVGLNFALSIGLRLKISFWF